MRFNNRFLVMLTLVTALIGLGHLALYQSLVFFFSISNPETLLWIKVIFVILTFSFAILNLLLPRGYSRILNILYTITATWLGTLHLLFLSCIAATLILILFLITGSDLYIPTIIGAKILALAVLVSIYGIFHANNTKIKRYEVKLPNLPATWKNKKIAFVADVHVGNVRGSRFAKKLAALVQKESPEFVMIVGDYYDGPPVPYKKMAEPFGNLNSTYGTFFTTGNHEEYRESSVYIDALKSVGIRVLQDEVVDINGLQLVGVNYFSSTEDEKQTQTFKKIKIDRSKPSILMKHAPTGIPIVEAAGINLQLSGHTHYGQMWPYGYLTKRIYGIYAYGLHQFKNLTVITTSGPGTWGPPQRVGTDGEVVVITLV